jgi:lysophospholipase L1-like esterase
MRDICHSTTTTTMILCLGLAVCQGAEQEHAAKDPGDRLPLVILLGDSIRINYQGTVKSELEGKVAVWSPNENCAHSLHTLQNLEKWVKGRNASVVHINVGLHDLFLSSKTDRPRHSIEVYSTNLGKIFAKLKELTDAQIVFALTTPVDEQRQASSETYKRVVRRNPDIVRYNQRAVEIAKKHGVRIDDIHSPAVEAGVKNVIRDDGVHLSSKGIEIVGKQVARCLLSTLNEPRN